MLMARLRDTPSASRSTLVVAAPPASAMTAATSSRVSLSGSGQGNVALDLNDRAVERKLAQGTRHGVAAELQLFAHLGKRRCIEAGFVQQGNDTFAGLAHHTRRGGSGVRVEYLAPSAAHTPREQPLAIRAAATTSSAAGHAAWATAPGVKPVSLGDAVCMADRVAASASIAASSTAAFVYSVPPEPASSRTTPRATNPCSAASTSPTPRSKASVTSAVVTGSVFSASQAPTPPSISPDSRAAYSARSSLRQARESDGSEKAARARRQ